MMLGARTAAWAKSGGTHTKKYNFIGLYLLKIYGNYEGWCEIGRIILDGLDITDSEFLGFGKRFSEDTDNAGKSWACGDNDNEGPGLFKIDGHNFFSIHAWPPSDSRIYFNTLGGYLAPIRLSVPLSLDGVVYSQMGGRYSTLQNRRITDYHFVASVDGVSWDSLYHYQSTPDRQNLKVFTTSTLKFEGVSFSDLSEFVRAWI